jgi:hypothetical protein
MQINAYFPQSAPRAEHWARLIWINTYSLHRAHRFSNLPAPCGGVVACQALNTRVGGRPRKHVSVLGLMLVLLLAAPAIANDYADCSTIDQLLKIDSGRAVAACHRLAEQGNIIAA